MGGFDTGGESFCLCIVWANCRVGGDLMIWDSIGHVNVVEQCDGDGDVDAR